MSNPRQTHGSTTTARPKPKPPENPNPETEGEEKGKKKWVWFLLKLQKLSQLKSRDPALLGHLPAAPSPNLMPPPLELPPHLGLHRRLNLKNGMNISLPNSHGKPTAPLPCKTKTDHPNLTQRHEKIPTPRSPSHRENQPENPSHGKSMPRGKSQPRTQTHHLAEIQSKTTHVKPRLHHHARPKPKPQKIPTQRREGEGKKMGLVLVEVAEVAGAHVYKGITVGFLHYSLKVFPFLSFANLWRVIGQVELWKNERKVRRQGNYCSPGLQGESISQLKSRDPALLGHLPAAPSPNLMPPPLELPPHLGLHRRLNLKNGMVGFEIISSCV
ncbi:hypothetical protein FCV25MIE_11733 [Fagus crenata]